MNRSGQTMIFMVMILVILAFVVLWNLDLHKILFVKFLCQNAGMPRQLRPLAGKRSA